LGGGGGIGPVGYDEWFCLIEFFDFRADIHECDAKELFAPRAQPANATPVV
jgi:hypothetical protein